MKNLLTKILFISLLFSTVVPSGIQAGVQANFFNWTTLWTTLKNEAVKIGSKTLNTNSGKFFSLLEKHSITAKEAVLVTTATWKYLKSSKQNILTTKIHGTTIVVKQGNITQEKDVDAIVNAANFNLAHDGGVAGVLRKADPEWNKHCVEKIKNFKDDGFKDGGIRAVVTPVFELKKKNGIQYIVNAVGPEGYDPQWEAKLKKTYLDALTASNKHGIKNIVFTPISTGIFAKNLKGKVVITPSGAAKIAILAVREFFEKNQHQFDKIQFTSIKSDGLVHFLAYKKALGLTLSDQEQKTAQEAEKEYIARL